MSDGGVYLLRIPGGGVLYDPLLGLAAAVGDNICGGLEERGIEALPAGFDESKEGLTKAPQRRQGRFSPAFAGLVVTRACNLACRYCDFRGRGDGEARMSTATAWAAVEAMAESAARQGRQRLEVHFFGGEPLLEIDLLRRVVERARAEAASRGLTTWFEMTTNGVAGEKAIRWVGANVDRVVLSLDAMPETTRELRVFPSGAGSSGRAFETACRLDESDAELVVRSCVDSDTVDRYPSALAKILRCIAPRVVCLEPVHSGASATCLQPPTAEQFCRRFAEARAVCDEVGIDLVFSGADLTRKDLSPCGVARDGCVVMPDGGLAACYLPPESWFAGGLDLSFGEVSADRSFVIDLEKLELVRALGVPSIAACRGCFCRWHCGGGCRVRHDSGGRDERWCRTVRSVATFQLLDACGVADVDLELACKAAAPDAWQPIERGGGSA